MTEREREREREESWWVHAVRGNTFLIAAGGRKATALKVPRKGPLVLLIKVVWRQVSEEVKVVKWCEEHCWECASEGRGLSIGGSFVLGGVNVITKLWYVWKGGVWGEIAKLIPWRGGGGGCMRSKVSAASVGGLKLQLQLQSVPRSKHTPSLL